MPIATDSGYLPDWLAALIGQGGVAANAPIGLFSETAASPSPAVGLLSSLPQFTGVRPDAPAFQGGNAPNGPLPDQSPTFSYMSPTPPWGGSGPSNSYPSMTMPQGPGPMNIGPGGAGPSFTGVSPTAPFTTNGPTSVQDQYANVPLPPRRPTSLTDFQAQSAEDPADINVPPPGRPNANVTGTAASGAPEAPSNSPGFLSKASDLIGGIYGAGGPGDALIALGLSNRTNGASVQTLNAMTANRLNQAKLAAFNLQLANQAQAQNATKRWLLAQQETSGENKGKPAITPEAADMALAQAANGDPTALHSYFKQYGEPDKYTPVQTPSGPMLVNQYDPTDQKPIGAGTAKIFKSVTDPQERAALGVSPGDYRPIQQNTATGQWAFQSPETAETAQDRKVGEAKGAGIADAITAGQAAPKKLQAVDIIDDASRAGKGNMTSGPAAERVLAGKQLLNSAFGWDFGNSVAPSEVISKTGFGLAAELARTINSQRGGTQAEFLRGLQNVPSLLVSDKGRTALTDIIRQGAKQEQALGKIAENFNPRTDGSWSDRVEQFYKDNPLKSPFSGKPLGQEDVDQLNSYSNSGSGTAETQSVNPGARKIPMWTYGQ